MSIPYVTIERGHPNNPAAPKKWYAQAKSSGELTFRKLAKEIAEGSTTVGGTFNMSGGSITGNTFTGSYAVGYSPNWVSGVYMSREHATFNMSGGSITGNTFNAFGSDVYFQFISGWATLCKMSMSGNAQIGNLLLAPGSFITIANNNFSGSVGSVDLGGGTAPTAASPWTGFPTVKVTICPCSHTSKIVAFDLPPMPTATLTSVVVAGEGVTLSQSIIRGFTLGDWIYTNGTRKPISNGGTATLVEEGKDGEEDTYEIQLGWHLYGAYPDETNVDIMGKLWYDLPKVPGWD